MAASVVFANYDFQDESYREVFWQWHRGPPLILLAMVGLICEVLYLIGRMRRTRALILLPSAIYQLKNVLFFLYATDSTWLPGIASAALIVVAAIVALEKRGPEMLSGSPLPAG
ncbi:MULTISPECIES: hypothetical protein [unclassified Rhodococcus (in: high G+C Gram-positive bacteria)]|uniref:hypothetical protein n=1 Tax=unclassified Rhodococcus (in: high G+C Gram-positive bacteria) TaxID=192944 RepID=UPI003393F213